MLKRLVESSGGAVTYVKVDAVVMIQTGANAQGRSTLSVAVGGRVDYLSVMGTPDEVYAALFGPYTDR